MSEFTMWRERPFDKVPRTFLQWALFTHNTSHPRLNETIREELDHRRRSGEPVPDVEREELLRRLEAGPGPLDPDSDLDSQDQQLARLITAVMVSAVIPDDSDVDYHDLADQDDTPDPDPTDRCADFIGDDGSSLLDPSPGPAFPEPGDGTEAEIPF